MFSPTHGEVSDKEMTALIKTFIMNSSSSDYHITVGTDSMNFKYTKVVKVVAIERVGHGGIFFYEIEHIKIMRDIRSKLYYETQTSLDLALRVTEALIDIDVNFAITIHVDAGYNGPTKQLIQEISGWVKACGFDVKMKPDSYAASSIADRISK
ncbi:MAG TPA: ribonuclease H-like YkuK family protein [Clostridiaceae bacterium]